MICSKCGGLAVAERSLDLYGRADRWRCVNCGWSLMMKNPGATADRASDTASLTAHLVRRQNSASDLGLVCRDRSARSVRRIP